MIEVNSLVRLKCGGPLMLVYGIYEHQPTMHPGVITISCYWFDKLDCLHNGEFLSNVLIEETSREIIGTNQKPYDLNAV
jgi:uncharacterized protein YodC (DUF2158 family)